MHEIRINFKIFRTTGVIQVPSYIINEELFLMHVIVTGFECGETAYTTIGIRDFESRILDPRKKI